MKQETKDLIRAEARVAWAWIASNPLVLAALIVGFGLGLML